MSFDGDGEMPRVVATPVEDSVIQGHQVHVVEDVAVEGAHSLRLQEADVV